MNKIVLLAILLSACGVPNKASEEAARVKVGLKSFQVRCPLSTIETTNDTVKANSYYYDRGGLDFYRDDVMFVYKQFPGTCVVKEITE